MTLTSPAPRAWTVEELLGAARRLEALFPPKTRVDLTVRGPWSSDNVSADIWVGNVGSKLKMVYGPTFEAAISAAELYAAEYVMSYREMTAADLGLDVAA